ncbi:hypothetical protein OJAV_G00078430 [Oryzias javanicus]|uniref:Uncharacterized protein n=1 Tax=Oryzias javanicus TaxID=123683 RepID=A0A3S2PBL9_ORYJA|nr:hypothetical protein OJAV_G00078430 [Oryzias javanicus]
MRNDCHNLVEQQLMITFKVEVERESCRTEVLVQVVASEEVLGAATQLTAMAPGFILWVSWAILFRSDIVSTNEGSYRLSHPSRNLHDDGPSTLSFDEGNKEAEETIKSTECFYKCQTCPSTTK